MSITSKNEQLGDMYEAEPKRSPLSGRVGSPSLDFDHFDPKKQLRDVITSRNTEVAIGDADVVEAFVLRVEEPGDDNYDPMIKMGMPPGEDPPIILRCYVLKTPHTSTLVKPCTWPADNTTDAGRYISMYPAVRFHKGLFTRVPQPSDKIEFRFDFRSRTTGEFLVDLKKKIKTVPDASQCEENTLSEEFGNTPGSHLLGAQGTPNLNGLSRKELEKMDRAGTSRDPSSWNPLFKQKTERIIERLKARGFQPTIVTAYRSPTSQAIKVKLGRSRASFGYHNFVDANGNPASQAADIADKRYMWNEDADGTYTNGAAFFAALGEEIAREGGLTWGGNWTSKVTVWTDHGIGWDPAHFEMRGSPGISRVQAKSNAVNNGFTVV